ncbi:MAG: GH116 family glycosyl-hydrolase, partial [Anaerolineae bacterium]|nr:GH116 family glycosyl-hydrolase [Anaerolineae bacterium]
MKSKRFHYTGNKTRAISFPLGGLGTGCIGLAGNGRLVDWEIFNKPGKGSSNGFSHFAIKAEQDGKVLDARVLHGDLHPPYMGDLRQEKFSSFGFGPPREYLTGVPHFQEVEFHGEFPIAELSFKSDDFPGQVSMRAFNPTIPLNEDDSGIPAAFFEIAVKNPLEMPVTYTVAGTLHNPLPAQNLNRYCADEDMQWLELRTDSLGVDELAYGELVLATDGSGIGHNAVSYCEYWFRGRWFDSLQVFWDDFNTPGPMHNRRYIGQEAGESNAATLAPAVAVGPGEVGIIRFVIAWCFPNRTNDWRADADSCACEAGIENHWQNYYARLFSGAVEAARYSMAKWDELYGKTVLFQQALFSSDLPEAALDAISANISVLKSPTVMRLEDGTFYGFEGCHPGAGCCEGSCTHVWNYAQALPFLYPSLERSVREANYKYNQRADGGMAFRLQLPLGVGPSHFRPCADGQFGDVLKVYREWKICGDTAWLQTLWPAVKRSIEFAWSPDNEDRWDPDKTGVLQGRQHHTLDMELFSPNSWLTGFYLGALKAGAEMAEALGEDASAQAYRGIFHRGKQWTDQHLYNGTYYFQEVDLHDR